MHQHTTTWKRQAHLKQKAFNEIPPSSAHWTQSTFITFSRARMHLCALIPINRHKFVLSQHSTTNIDLIFLNWNVNYKITELYYQPTATATVVFATPRGRHPKFLFMQINYWFYHQRHHPHHRLDTMFRVVLRSVSMGWWEGLQLVKIFSISIASGTSVYLQWEDDLCVLHQTNLICLCK